MNKKRILYFILACFVICFIFHKKILYWGWVTTVELVCEGEDNAQLQDMDPRLRKKILPVMETLKKEGFELEISSVYRSPDRQLCLYNLSKSIKRFSFGYSNGVTSTKKSCHNHTIQKTPSALAIDLHLYSNEEQEVKYYLRLRELVRKSGLHSGGDFEKTNKHWAKFNLGWDPGHVELKNCETYL